MADFQFGCPQCGKLLDANESYCGQVAQCPYCGKGIVIPRKRVVAASQSAIPKRLQRPEPGNVPADENIPQKGKNAKLKFYLSIFSSVL